MITRIKHIGLSALVYFCYLFGACIVTTLVEALLVYILDRFVIIPYPALTVIRIVIYSVGVPAILSVPAYAEGYREANCAIGESIAAYIPAMILHLLFAMLFKFEAFVSGSVRFTAGLIHNGWDITYESLINETPYGLFLSVFILYGVLYAAVMIACKHHGAKKRLSDRQELMGENA